MGPSVYGPISIRAYQFTGLWYTGSSVLARVFKAKAGYVSFNNGVTSQVPTATGPFPQMFRPSISTTGIRGMAKILWPWEKGPIWAPIRGQLGGG